MNNLDDSLTFRLFARPSFLEGMGRIFDLGSNSDNYNRSANPELADRRALESDWRMVGRDLRTAMKAHGQQEE